MIELEKYDLSKSERESIENLLKKTGYDLSVEKIWEMMDYVWKKFKCNQFFYSHRKYSEFYSHPIWLLNGIFIEQHSYSMEHRINLAKSIKSKKPKRVLDFGGGFGTLAKLIAKDKHINKVEIFEPYPSKHLISSTRYVDNIAIINLFNNNYYDIVVSTDVLEHVHEPLALLLKLVKSLKKGGYIYVANCFSPVIRCHLPCTFHLRITFDLFCNLMGLKKVGTCSNNYAQIYQRKSLKIVNIFFINIVEICSKIIWFFIRPFRPFLRFILSFLR